MIRLKAAQRRKKYLVLLPRRSDHVIEHANVQTPWDKASLGRGRFRIADVELRTTGIMKGSTNNMNVNSLGFLEM